MEAKQKFPWLVIVLVVGGLCALCFIALAVGGFYYYFNAQKISQPTLIKSVETFAPAATLKPIQTTVPILPEATSTSTPEATPSGLTLTGDQQLNVNYLYDDFSSEALGWPVFDDGKTILKYENGQYSFQITEADTFD